MTRPNDGVAVILSVASAVSFAVGVVLQHRVVAEPKPSVSGLLRLMCRAMQNPVWLCGTVIDVAGVALQAAAVTVGRLSVTQPVLTTGLVAAIAGAAFLEHRLPSSTEVVGSALLVAGLSAEGLVLPPAADESLHLQAAFIALAVSGLLCVVAGLPVARDGVGRRVLAGIASGVSFSVSAVFTKIALERLHEGIGPFLVSWQTLLMVLVGAAVFIFNQWVLSLGALRHTLPALSVAEPVSGVLLGSLVFSEKLASSTQSVLLALASSVVAIAGVIGLSRAAAARPVDLATQNPA